jgi:hypothetical protein
MPPSTLSSTACNTSRRRDHTSYRQTPAELSPSRQTVTTALWYVSLSAFISPTLAWHPVMTARSTPEDGDIVVREEQRESKVVYVLHTAPGADQYVLRSREDAIRQAVTFAKRQSVRVWLTHGDYDFALLEDFRVVESV